MKIFGLEFGRKKTSLVAARPSGFWGTVMEPFAGAWQRNIICDNQRNITSFSAVYSCVKRISSDVAKLRPRLMELSSSGVWIEKKGPSPFKRVIQKPNDYQNRIQFLQSWVIARLLHGNAYILKERDGSGRVKALYVLDSRNVTPLVSSDGSVYYQLSKDDLSGITDAPIVPASEIIHDRPTTLWHPLVGVSPIYACGVSATQGNRIQQNSAHFFENMSRPSGMLTMPGDMSPELQENLKAQWEKNYSAGNIGRLFVAGNGLEYKPMMINAVDAQLIDQLKWTVEDVARCFHVPLWKIGAGTMPASSNSEVQDQSYYSETLQEILETIELMLEEGLDLPENLDVKFDLDQLMRMNTADRYKANSEAVKGGWMKPNEARAREGYEPITGGDTCYMQQQQFSLEALSKRDAKADPFAKENGTAPAQESEPEDDDTSDDGDDDIDSKTIMDAFVRELLSVTHA